MEGVVVNFLHDSKWTSYWSAKSTLWVQNYDLNSESDKIGLITPKKVGLTRSKPPKPDQPDIKKIIT